MTGAASFVTYTGLAIICLILMKWTGAFFDAILVRLAAILFLAAGFIGGSGMIGSLITKLFVQVNTNGDAAAKTGVGSAVMYLVWFGLGLGWILCILPERWFNRAIPDWLSIGGLVLPAGVHTVPGPAGKALLGIMQTITNIVVTPINSAFGR